MKKEKYFHRAFFSADVIKEASVNFDKRVPEETKEGYVDNYLVVRTQDGQWTHDSEEEFFGDYRKGTRNAVYQRQYGGTDYGIRLQVFNSGTDVAVTSPNRADIEVGFEVFEKY